MLRTGRTEGPGYRARALRLLAVVVTCAVVLSVSACDVVPSAIPGDANVLDPHIPSKDDDSNGGDPSEDFVDPDVTGAAKLAIVVEPVFCCSPLSVQFAADLGPDRSVNGVSFDWDFGDGRRGRGSSLRHTFPFASTYPVQLTATLSSGDTISAVYQVTVGFHDPIALPDGSSKDPSDPGSGELKAVAGPDIETYAGAVVLLDGRNSKGSGVHDLRFRWIQVSGPGVALVDENAVVTSFVAPEPDGDVELSLGFELVVAEGSTTASDSLTVRVVQRSEPLLVADAGDGVILDGNTQVVLDATRSVGSGSRPMAYSWVQIEGPPVTLSSAAAAVTSFVAPPAINKPIYLTFELTVTQGSLVATDEVEIIVAPVITMEAPSQQEVLTWLSALQPLQKVHYSWPMPTASLREFDRDLLYEYMRISHAMSVWGEWVDQETLNRALSVASEINDTNPEIPVTLGIVFRPWTRAFPADAPPTYNGPEAAQEIELFQTRLATIKGWVEEANAAQAGAAVEVGAVILECERFFVKPADDPKYAEWNAAMTAKHNVMYDAAKAAFPDARVEWYARGISDLFTLNERGDSYSVPLYHVPDRVSTRTLFRRTYDAAVAKGVDNVTPWIALGSGYIIQASGKKVWSFDYDYDLIYSWHVGAEVNDSWFGDRPEQFAPWNASEIVIFWPAPWEARIPNWPRHFVAYVRGAHNITDMPR